MNEWTKSWPVFPATLSIHFLRLITWHDISVCVWRGKLRSNSKGHSAEEEEEEGEEEDTEKEEEENKYKNKNKNKNKKK